MLGVSSHAEATPRLCVALGARVMPLLGVRSDVALGATTPHCAHRPRVRLRVKSLRHGECNRPSMRFSRVLLLTLSLGAMVSCAGPQELAKDATTGALDAGVEGIATPQNQERVIESIEPKRVERAWISWATA